MQLINILVESLKDITLPKANRKLIVTGPEPVPFEVSDTGLQSRDDLKTDQEEADTIMVSQMLAMINNGYRRIQLICEDTDVFVLLVHHYDKSRISELHPPVEVLMQYPPSSPKAISISTTINSLPSKVVSSLLAAHVLTGCDTVPHMFGIGKKTALNFLFREHTDFNVEELGNTDPSLQWETVERGCVDFIRGLYHSCNNKDDLEAMRYTKWVEKSKANTMTTVTDLQSFPPTLEAVRLNMRRAHYQCSIWKNVNAGLVNSLDVEQWGWTKDTANKCLDSVFMDPTTPIAPESLLKLTFCGCCSEEPCSSKKCGCRKADVMCCSLCKYKGKCKSNGVPSAAADDDLAMVDVHMQESEDENDDEYDENEDNI
ncbi:MAG: hypothetical protein GY816_13510 [Cytophagales bacterium]|nr:hypothetical protein [Cytophagales bacterium]